MNVLGVGMGELVFVLLIIVLVMGPERMPQMARQWGKMSRIVQSFARNWQTIKQDVARQMALEDTDLTLPRAPASPPSFPPAEEQNTIAPPAAPAVETLEAGPAPADEVTHGG